MHTPKHATAAIALVATLGLVTPNSFGGSASADMSDHNPNTVETTFSCTIGGQIVEYELISTFNSTISFGEQRRGTVQQDLLEAQQALSLAENVEKPSVVEDAASRKTTARSVGRSVVVGGLIGLIVGLLAAILWEPAQRRFAARPA